MSEHMRLSVLQRNVVVRAAFVTVGVLLIPLWGEFNVDGWNWGSRGFVNAGVFVFSGALLYQLAAKTKSSAAYRLAMGLAVTTAFVLTWANFVAMADVNPAHALYFAVPIVCAFGAAIARLRPHRMALAMVVTAVAQALVPFVALAFFDTPLGRAGGIALIGPNTVFILLFAASASLFRRAARNARMPRAH